MAIVTPVAAFYLEAALERAERDESQPLVVRIARQFGQWAARLDRQAPGDETVESNGRTILAFDEEAADALLDTVIDVEDRGTGPELVLKTDDRSN